MRRRSSDPDISTTPSSKKTRPGAVVSSDQDSPLETQTRHGKRKATIITTLLESAKTPEDKRLSIEELVELLARRTCVMEAKIILPAFLTKEREHKMEVEALNERIRELSKKKPRQAKPTGKGTQGPRQPVQEASPRADPTDLKTSLINLIEEKFQTLLEQISPKGRMGNTQGRREATEKTGQEDSRPPEEARSTPVQLPT